MFFRQLLHLIAFGLLAGCANFGDRESLEGHGSWTFWSKHRQQLTQLNSWQISGKVGIRGPKDSGSATLIWQQRQNHYDIRLSGPLGQGAVHLTSRLGKINLGVANQGRYEASTEEELIGEQLDWSLPMSNLVWWVRGLPAHGSESRVTLNADSRLARLEQDGWKIEYFSYVQQNGFWLPQRIKLHGPELSVKLVVKDWQPRQLGQ